MRIQIAVVAIAFLASTTFVFASENSSKDDAVAMVKKAVATIKAEGPEKGYAEISTPGGNFVNGEIYAFVVGPDGTTLAQPANPKMIGMNLMDVQDVDGKYFVKDMVENGRKQASFWYEYKFANPATKKVQVKDSYCEQLNEVIVCAGVYRP